MSVQKVLVFGTFDHLHPGHHFVLKHAFEKGELYVVVARDATVERIKNKSPDQSEEERQQALQKAYPAATVALGHESDFRQPIQDIGPDLIVLGYDQRLPPGVSESDFPCPVERLPAFKPEKYKSSLRRA